MKLSYKLTFTFLLVSLIAIGLAALFVWISTSTQFSQYLMDQRQVEFVARVTEYYQIHSNWQGVDTALRSAGLLPPLVAPGATPPDPQPFALADQNRVIIISGGQYEAGQKIKQGLLDRGISIEVGGVVVGTVLITGEKPAPNSIEQQYVDSVNRSLLIAAFGGASLALLLGVFLARSLTRPVQDLMIATRTLALNKPGQPVPIRSADELGELSASFNRMSADLARLNQNRRQMTADIAHDLRNPLTVISGYLESLQDGKLNPTPERIAIMQSEVRHLQHLVDDLRTLSLADAGELALHPESTNPVDLLERTAAVHRHQAEQHKIRLVIEADAKIPDVRLDPARIEQVLGNLVSNALRYTPQGGEIRLTAHQADNSLLLEVQDTGSGIPADILPHIFERSYRGDPSRRGDESGLGLAIARSIVELHGGSIAVSSQGEGLGSTFSIKIPIE